MMGVTPEEAVREIRKKGADVVGANCGNGIENMVKIARIMRKVDDGPLVIHSNAGLPEIVNGRIIYPETPKFMAGKFKEMKDIGINIFGGCCGTTPDHIAAIKSVVLNH
jgi:5-methyltetrahydrofolate--homocysteine methyltransferase